ncbi:MAG: PD40 domain-containing protein [Deltaproteobacteria bacterium]|nr:PD40 domain-containing protein [Deltaproteobacteria bacterium]
MRLGRLVRHAGCGFRFVMCVVALLSFAARVDAASFDPKLKWHQHKTPHFMIYAARSLDGIAQRVGQLAEEAYAILPQKFDWKPLGRTVVVLTDVQDVANGLATVLPYNYLHLRVTAPRPDTALANYDDWLRTLIMHEFTHIIHMDQARGVMKLPRFLLGKLVSPNGVLPGWMREGIAVYEETQQTQGGRNRGSFSNMLIRTAVDQQKFPKIDQADGLGWRWPGFLPQYIYGGKFLEWLANTYGEDKLIRFQKKSAASPLFFMNNLLAKQVWKKSFYQLWREWQAEVSKTAQAEITAVRAAGETPLEPVTDDGTHLSALALSPDGTHLVYTTTDPHRPTEIRLRDLRNGEEQRIRAKQGATQAAFDPSGNLIAYAAYTANHGYRYYSDIFVFDRRDGKLRRLTASRRAQDPSFAPDGKSLLYVVEDAGTQRLVRYDLTTWKEQPLPIPHAPFTRFSHPQWSPDGQWLAVSSWQAGQQDIYLYRPDGRRVQRITNDRALDLSPSWDRTGRYLYFSSDRSGISNVYRYDMRRRRAERLTNVVTGLFEPQPAPDGKTLYAQYYHGAGFGIRKLAIEGVAGDWGLVTGDRTMGHQSPATSHQPPVTNPQSPATSHQSPLSPSPFPSKRYHGLSPRLFIPRYFIPGFVATGSGVLLSAVTGSSDPLRWHLWQAGGTYRTDAKYPGYFFNYTLNRFSPIMNFGVLNYATDFGNLTFLHADGTLRTVHMYEKRLRGYAGIAVPYKRQIFSLQYFMENRDNIPALTAEERALLNLDRFAGFSATYGWGRQEQYPASISPEEGHRLVMNFTVTDKILGSNEPNEQQIFSGDFREYIKLPWRHHVLALRVKGGKTWGDTLVQGTFGMGGALGEGALGGGGGFTYFPLRGLPAAAMSRANAMLMSAEYRLPLGSPQRGLGTTPFFLQNIHAALFADFGNAWNNGEDTGKWFFDRFFLGTGVELRGDFVVGHGLPVQGRLGYGVIAVNRGRLGALTDSLLGNQVKYGTLILQFGAQF